MDLLDNLLYNGQNFGASKIYAFDIFEDKLSLAKKLGATDLINSKNVDPIEKYMNSQV